jgi:hypothetical protein
MQLRYLLRRHIFDILPLMKLLMLDEAFDADRKGT